MIKGCEELELVWSISVSAFGTLVLKANENVVLRIDNTGVITLLDSGFRLADSDYD
jgi:hypothetical protein